MAAAVPLLRVRFRRLTADRHALEFERADGSRDGAELETRSTLWHDFVHFAVESEAGLGDAFFGRVARGVPYGALGDVAEQPDEAADQELWYVERVVGPLQSAARKQVEPAAFVAMLRGYLESTGGACPPWFDEALVARAPQRLRELEGRWRKTPFGEVLELRFGG